MNKVIIVHYEEDSDAVEKFEEAVEHLWCKNVDYTRNAIISILGGLTDADAVITRLLMNEEELGGAIAPYYGSTAAAELTRLLKEHVMMTSEVIKAIRDADAKITFDLENGLKTNADAIATFLDSADSDNWPKAAVLGLLFQHIDHTLASAKARFAKDWTSDFAAFENSKLNIEKLAYAMADGILKKFPEQFVMQYSSKTINKKK
jgi:hypothetical protein